MQALNAGSGALAILMQRGCHARCLWVDSAGEPWNQMLNFVWAVDQGPHLDFGEPADRDSSYAYGDRLVDLLPALRMPYSPGHLERITGRTC